MSLSLHEIRRPWVLGGLWLFLSAAVFAGAPAQIDVARTRQVASMLTSHAAGPCQPASNRVAWEALAVKPAFQKWLKTVDQQLARPLPAVSDALYLDFSKTGNRTRWQEAEFARRGRLTTLALAECLEYRGRFLVPLEALIKEICGERTWVYPAHDRSLRNFKGQAVDIDLGSSYLGWQMALIDYLLGEKLTPPTRALIRENLQRRIFKPYRDMVEGRVEENFWMRATHNWNAVCLAGVTGAALAGIDSREERAWHIAAAEYYIRNFLDGFGLDGYCSEGLDYWSYGFGHFVMLGETVRQATGGGVDFAADPMAYAPALFPQRIEILNSVYPSIADCHPGSQPDQQAIGYLSRRMHSVAAAATGDPARPSGNLMSCVLYSFLPQTLPAITNAAPAESPLRSWFPDGGVLVCRPASGAKLPFAVSLKGGNNAEHHNHNDIGSFIVVAGRSMVLVDPGAEVYTARTFSSRRYESDVLSSFGHNVPVVAGKLQRPGANARARVVQKSFTDNEDRLTLDLSSGYDVPELTRLERSFSYSRANDPVLTVKDEVAFQKPETFETALVTWGEWRKVSDTELEIREKNGAVRVAVETGGIPWEITCKQLEADVHTPKKATRIGLRLKSSVTRAVVSLAIRPVP